MPSRRIPRYVTRGVQASGSELLPSSPGVAGTMEQPPVTVDDPRFRAFLSVTFDILYDWNIQTGAVYFSDQLDAMLGLPPGRFPRSLEGWLEHLHPDDRAATSDELWETVVRGEHFRTEYRLRADDGSYVLVEDQGVVLVDQQGRPTNMVGAMRDLSGEREAQAARREADELQRVLFRISNPTWRVDAAGRYIDADSQALQFLQHGRDDMIGRTVRDDFPPQVYELITGSRPIDDAGHELEVDCAVGGGIKTLMLTVIPSRRGEERSYVLLGTDITAKKALQRELARTGRALRRQATILDERNTALRVLLQQREQDRKELEQRIVRNVEQLIEPTLDRLSRTLRHRPERLEVEALRLNLREIVAPFATRLGHKGPADVPLTRREFEVAAMVRFGKTTDEIAEALHISRSAVSFHRANLRRKLGLPKGGQRLATHLAALARE